jgi:hypothetical protein
VETARIDDKGGTVRSTFSLMMVLLASVSFAADDTLVADPGAVVDTKVAGAIEEESDPPTGGGGAVVEAKVAGAIEEESGPPIGGGGAVVEAKVAGAIEEESEPPAGGGGAIADAKVAPAAPSASRAIEPTVHARDGRTILNLNAPRAAKK